jgi:transposase
MQCPRCGHPKSWVLRDGRRRCARCRHDWRPERLPLRLNARQWRALLQWFARGLSSAQIARETHLDRKRVLRALSVVRNEMAERVPRELRSDSPPEENGLSARQGPPVLGLYVSNGHVWADVMASADVERIEGAFRERRMDRPEWIIPAPYSAIVYRGRLYRPSETGEGRPSTPFGHVEAFWAYLQRQLRAKGGVRRSRLRLYLAEYVWRYNNRKLNASEQLRELLLLVRQARPGARSVPFPRRHQLGATSRSPATVESKT